MNEVQRFAGINITASRLQFVEVEKESDQFFIANLGQTFISPPINFEEQKETMLTAQLQTAFDEIKIRNPIFSTVASFSLPPELFITIQLPYDINLLQGEIVEEFRWELSQLFPFIPTEELAIKFYELEKNFLSGNNNALIVALNKKYLLVFKNFCTRNNLTPRLVDNASITANGFINNYYKFEKDSVTVNIYNSRKSTTFFLNISSKPTYVKVLQKTGIDIIHLIAKELSEEASKRIASKPIKYAFISGEEIGAELLSEIRLATGLDFIKFNPFDIIKFKPELQITGISSDQYSTFTSATGIASRFN